MRRRQLKWLWARLKQLAAMQLTREELLMKLGAARDQGPDGVAPGRRSRWTRDSADVHLSARPRQAAAGAPARRPLSAAHQSHRGTIPPSCGATICSSSQVEEAFKNLKGDLAIRPIFHQHEARIEAHIFIAFLAYCLHVTLGRRLHALAPGLTPRSVLEKFAAMQMIDVHVPTTDGRELHAHPLHPARTRTATCCSTSSSSNCPPSRHPKSPPPQPSQPTPCSADLRRSARGKSIT